MDLIIKNAGQEKPVIILYKILRNSAEKYKLLFLATYICSKNSNRSQTSKLRKLSLGGSQGNGGQEDTQGSESFLNTAPGQALKHKTPHGQCSHTGGGCQAPMLHPLLFCVFKLHQN